MSRFFCISDLTLLLFSGCTTIVEKAGQVLDGTAFAEKKIARYTTPLETDKITLFVVEDKAANKSIILIFDNFQMMKLRGSYPDENGVFYLNALEYLGGNTHGWNEFTLELSGTGSLALDETAVLSVTEIENVEITDGRIHRYDTRITGNDAITSLRNRRERILALVEWMKSLDAPSMENIEIFENYWKPVIFPEMVRKKNKPADWIQEDDVFIKAEDIRWNKGYTERVFPEILRNARNSGTLFRDWEEALYWIYLKYEWDDIIKLLSRQIILTKIK
jgi:hypothetical protein